MKARDTALKKLAKGAGVSFIGKVLGTGIKYLTQVSLAWFLGAESFGLLTLGIVIYQLCELFARMGLESGAVRYVSIYCGKENPNKLKGTLLQALSLSFGNGVVLGLALFLGADYIALNIFAKPELASVLRIFAFALPFGASMTVGAFATTGFQTTQYKTYVWEILLPLSNLILALSFCAYGLGLEGAAAAWALAVITALVAILYFIRNLFPAVISKTTKPIFECRKLLKFSIPLSLSSFLWLVLIWTDSLMLGYFRSASAVGIYRAASQTALLMTLFTSSLITIFAPMIASHYGKGEDQKVNEIFKNAARWSFLLSLPLFLIVGVSSKDILHVFGSEFEVGWIPLIILAAGQLARSGAGGLSIHMLAMSGHQHLKLYGDILLAITNVTLNLVLIPHWGMVGAAIATGVSIAGVNLLRIVQLSWVLGVRSLDWSYLKIAVIGAVSTVIGLVVKVFLPTMHHSGSSLIVSGIIVFFYILLILKVGLEKSDQIILEKIRRRLEF